MGDLKEKLRQKMYELSITMTGRTPAEIKEMFVKKKYSLIQIFIAFIIPVLIFFPIQLREMLLPIFIFLIIIIVVFIILMVFFPAAGFMGTGFVVDIVAGLVLLGIILSLTQFLNCGSQSCFWVVSSRFGTLGAFLAFIVVLVVFLIIALTTSGIKFYVISFILTIILMFVMIPLISPKIYYSFCNKIPFIYGSFMCKSREVRVDPMKTVKVPVTGGISVDIKTPMTMYAGEPYEFIYTITNKYYVPINFDVKAEMFSYYGSGVSFYQPYQVKKNVLPSDGYYQDTVYIDPEELQPTATCPYNTLVLGVAKGMKNIEEIEEKIECSNQKPCKDPNYVCVKLDTFECGCVDWIDAVCSKNSLKIKLTVKHDGVFVGNASLYYSDEIASPTIATELVQGPLAAIIELLPNPYIASIHQYREDVDVYVRLRNYGSGSIIIKDFNLEPISTTIHTIDKEKEIEVIEEIGTEKIGCKDITEIVPDGLLEHGIEVGGKLCSLKPPFIKTTIKDFKTGSIKEVENVTFDKIKYFCEKRVPPSSDSGANTRWSKFWNKIYEAVDETGLCEILKRKEDDDDKKIVKSALTGVDLNITFSYERVSTYYSQEIIPYTRTKKCIERTG